MSKKQSQNRRKANGKLSIKLKILLIAVLPILFVSGLSGWLIHIGSNRLIESKTREVEAQILEKRRAVIKDYMSLAVTAIEQEYENREKPQALAQKAVKQILNNLTFGTDGYFFAYDSKGTLLVNAHSSELVGKTLWHSQDKSGHYAIRDLMNSARNGDGFHIYRWPKPSNGQETLKLGYATILPRWDWMIGTGAYLDEVQRDLALIRSDIMDDTRHLKTYIFIATLLVVGFTALGISILNYQEHKLADEKLKALAKRIVEVQEDERQRVSSELHDGINQMLVSIRHRLELALDQKTSPEKSQTLVEKCLSILDTTIADIRRISKALHPSALNMIGLGEAMRELAQDFGESTQLAIKTESCAVGDKLSQAAKLTFYRVAQEALTNIVRHASAKRVNMRISCDDTNQTVTLTISDDGTGIADPGQIERKGGLGIRNMFERLESLDGSLHIGKADMGGLELEATLPQDIEAKL